MNKKTSLYIITPTDIQDNELLDSVKILLSHYHNHIEYLQLRIKEERSEKIIEIGKKIYDICKSYNVKFIINDFYNLINKIPADGVHVGLNSLDDNINIEYIRTIIGQDKILGISCYNNLDNYISIANKSIDYISFGAFFPSNTKPNAKKASLSLLQEYQQNNYPTPFGVIGGINENNIKSLLPYQPNYICLCDAIWNKNNNNIENCQKIIDLIK